MATLDRLKQKTPRGAVASFAPFAWLSRSWLHRTALPAALINVLILSCESRGIETWPQQVRLSVVGVRHTFDDNWEVKVRLTNEGDADFVLDQLPDSEAQLRMDNGTKLALHAISLGRAKKVVIRAHDAKSTAFLFQSSRAQPIELALKGKRFPVEKHLK